MLKQLFFIVFGLLWDICLLKEQTMAAQTIAGEKMYTLLGHTEIVIDGNREQK